MARALFRLPARLASKLAIDAIMTALFVSALTFRATGPVPHEWIGVGFAALFALHTAVNLGWYRSLFRGRYGVRRVFGTITNMALLASMLVVCVTGVLQSRHIFGLSQFFDGSSLRAAHSLAGYWSLVFIGIHTGLHWDMILAFLGKKMAFLKRAGTLIPLRLGAFVVALCGVWASYDRLMGSKLFLGFSFDFWDPARPLVLFLAVNMAIIGLYAVAAHYLQKTLSMLPRQAPLPQNPGSIEKTNTFQLPLRRYIP